MSDSKEVTETREPHGFSDEKDVKGFNDNEPTSINSHQASSPMDGPEPEEPKLSFAQKVKREFLTMGSATQIVSAALLALAIGLIVSTQVSEVPDAAVELVNIPGDLWLRALKAVGMWFPSVIPSFTAAHRIS